MMEQTQDNTPEQSVEEPAPLSVGNTLREARERAGLAVEDVVNRLKFAPRQIRALEDDAFDQLPEGAFLRGFVRSYARLLQLDETPLLAALPDAHGQESVPVARESVEVPFPSVYSMRKSNIVWLAAALLVALALGVFTWMHGRKPIVLHSEPVMQQTAPSPAASAVATAPAAEPASAESAATPVSSSAAVPQKVQQAAGQGKVKFHASADSGPIHMVFGQDSWVEVKDGNGNIVMSQINTAGSEQYLDGTPPFELTIGHASGVKLYYKGKPVDLATKGDSKVAHVTLE